ncbi:hypothetical protein Vretimale_1469 [Volvox reticuliferus]|uniref:Aspartyl/asparaginy/proline hydroxylase domain-containing protein n=1 Tax=Volvox reticuliferus TaxID=1737510 RepID=A0A8J4D5E9_9CHLO|nr:hypothetical protein Vretifemale_10852 [Volvox reticuliferus]GIL95452.1 hypothetical protein Vretimale_1469 [Volvox reticuliferus]
MPATSTASRSRVGHAYKHLKFLSPRARKLLSISFAAGLCFFALLSLSIYVKDPDSIRTRKNEDRSSQRRSLAVSSTGAKRIGRQKGMSVSSGNKPFRLILASHNRLFWYYPGNDSIHVLHEGEGVHYGVFPGEVDNNAQMKTVWNVIRPHNWHPKTSQEFLVQFDAETGREVNRVRIESRFTHDAVRRGDRVYVANTEGGEVQELHFPDMKLVRGMRLFTLKQHVNTLAPLDDGAVWAVLHNLGKSDAVKIDPNADPRPRVVAEVKEVGLKAHGLVFWRGQFVMLDSENGALVAVDPATGAVRHLWQAPQTEDPPKFLKGLCVVDEVAYFGLNVWGPRSDRDSLENNAELAAVDLNTGALLWRRTVQTRGLLNIVAAPGLGEASTYRAMASTGGVAEAGFAPSTTTSDSSTGNAAAITATPHGDGEAAGRTRYLGQETSSSSKQQHQGLKAAGTNQDMGKVARSGKDGGKAKDALALGINDTEVIAATQQLIDMGYRPKTSGRWASGRPRLDLKIKNSRQSWDAGISLPLMQVNIDKLKELVLGMPDEMWSPERQRRENAAVDGRKDNMNKFKPGVEALYMVFSDQSTEHVYRFPYYDYFKSAIEPLLEQIVGKEDVNKVVRLQFARMKPGTEIKPHQDMGGYAKFAHRIHLPVVTNPNVSFQVCPEVERQASLGRRVAATSTKDCLPIPMAEGMVFELNNRVMHLVLNRSNLKRVQMVVDVAEEPRVPRRLKPGTVCNYDHAVMVCPQENVLPDYP